MDIGFLIAQNSFLQEYLKIILYLYQLQNTLDFLLAQLSFVCRILKECQEKVLKI